MANITYHLPSFPTLNQNNEPANPYPNVNADMDCVPTSIAAALTWFTGTQYYGDEVIDQVYGSSYTGGTAGSAYEAYCAARGVKLYPVNGTPDELVTAIHTYLHEDAPVLVTVPGQWNNPATSGQNPGDVTHVMVVCGDGPGVIQVMNPWTGAFEVYSDSWFVVKLCYGQIWPMERIMLDLSNATAAQFFKAQADGSWKCANDFAIKGGILAAYRAWPAQGSLFGLTALGLPLADESTPADKPGTAIQPFERGVLVYDPNHTIDHPEGAAGACYLAHTDLVPDPQLAQAQSQLAKVAQDNATFQATIADLNKKLAALQTAQGLSLTAEQAAAINQVTPLLVGLAAAAPSFTTAFANVPRPNVTTPLPIAPVAHQPN